VSFFTQTLNSLECMQSGDEGTGATTLAFVFWVLGWAAPETWFYRPSIFCNAEATWANRESSTPYPSAESFTKRFVDERSAADRKAVSFGACAQIKPCLIVQSPQGHGRVKAWLVTCQTRRA
jgi:hypothetical protein